MKVYVIAIIFILFSPNDVAGWRRRRRRRRRTPPRRNCAVNTWSTWSACTHACGNAGTQSRWRTKSIVECCGGTCPYRLNEARACNRNACRNGGRPTYGRCNCSPGWTGTCCQSDVNECLRKPCQHNCHNVFGSFTCSCQSCYTKAGTRCNLQQCKIGGKCYGYGRINPGNPCQDCQRTRETVWTNNNALSCSDGNLCTRNDKCVNGVCRGTPFTCRSCESCDGSGCRIKPGFCVLEGKCYKNGTIRPGNPCQWCNPAVSTTKWTNRNGIPCDDGENCTRSDTCQNGQCKGTNFSCNTLCQYCNGNNCSLKTGFRYVAGKCIRKIAGPPGRMRCLHLKLYNRRIFSGRRRYRRNTLHCPRGTVAVQCYCSRRCRGRTHIVGRRTCRSTCCFKTINALCCSARVYYRILRGKK